MTSPPSLHSVDPTRTYGGRRKENRKFSPEPGCPCQPSWPVLPAGKWIAKWCACSTAPVLDYEPVSYHYSGSVTLYNCNYIYIWIISRIMYTWYFGHKMEMRFGPLLQELAFCNHPKSVAGCSMWGWHRRRIVWKLDHGHFQSHHL